MAVASLIASVKFPSRKYNPVILMPSSLRKGRCFHTTTFRRAYEPYSLICYLKINCFHTGQINFHMDYPYAVLFLLIYSFNKDVDSFLIVSIVLAVVIYKLSG